MKVVLIWIVKIGMIIVVLPIHTWILLMHGFGTLLMDKNIILQMVMAL